MTTTTKKIFIDGLYEEAVFQNSDRITSLYFTELALTVAQVLAGGEV